MDDYQRRRLIRHLERAQRAYELHLSNLIETPVDRDPTSPGELEAAIDDVKSLLKLLKKGTPLA